LAINVSVFVGYLASSILIIKMTIYLNNMPRLHLTDRFFDDQVHRRENIRANLRTKTIFIFITHSFGNILFWRFGQIPDSF